MERHAFETQKHKNDLINTPIIQYSSTPMVEDRGNLNTFYELCPLPFAVYTNP